jgi:hypothetical protein
MSTVTLARPALAHSRLGSKFLGASILAAGAVGMFSLMVIAALVGVGSVSSGGVAESFGVSPLAQSEIPPQYLSLYQEAAQRYGLDWAILAGIGKVECDHGRDPDPSCYREGAVNSAGAGGPAQFLASTWSAYGVDGDDDGLIDRWDPADAIFSMAHYLHASGAPANYHKAIFTYNHADWYVKEVEHWASLYRGPPNATVSNAPGVFTSDWPGVGPVEFTQGMQAVLSPRRARTRAGAAGGAGDGDRRKRASGAALRRGGPP